MKQIESMKKFPYRNFIFWAITLILSCVCFNSCKKEKAYPLEYLKIFDKDTTFLRKGNSYKFSCSFSPSNGINPDFRWETSDNSVATVTGDGTVTAVNIGIAIIKLWVNDGTGLKVSKTIVVMEKPSISIKSITELTYYSASFVLQYYMGGGDIRNSFVGIVWDTVPELNIAKVVGNFKFTTISNNYNINIFDAGTKFYAHAYIKTPLDTVYSESQTFETLPLPMDIFGNYMLNIPLAYGYVAKANGWIYYRNMTDGNKLYKIKEDLSEKQKLCDVVEANSINIIGSNVYFSAYKQGGMHNIMHMKLDETKYALYSNNYTFGTWGAAIVYNNYIYPSNGFFRFSTDGKNTIRGIGFNEFTNIYNNKLYFCFQNINQIDTLYSINVSNLDGTGIEEIHRGYSRHWQYGQFLGIYENAAYFKENVDFKKIDLDNPGIVETLPIRISIYNITNFSIYFSNIDDSNKLYKSDLNGLSVIKICDDVVKYISVIDDWLFYYNSDNHLYKIKQDGTNRQLID